MPYRYGILHSYAVISSQVIQTLLSVYGTGLQHVTICGWLGREWMAAYLLSATCAAMTRCRSTTNRQLAHWQSLQRQVRLWPFRHDTTPWLRHRAHFGVLSNRLDDDDDVVEPPRCVVGNEWSPSVWIDRRGQTPAGSSMLSSSSEQPSMSRYSSEVSLSEAALLEAPWADIVAHICSLCRLMWTQMNTFRTVCSPDNLPTRLWW